MKREGKKQNWDQLNKKVLKNFGKLQLTAKEISDVIDCHQGAIEKILKKVKDAMDLWKKKKPTNPASNQKKYIEDKLAQKRHIPENQSALEFTNPDLAKKMEQIKQELAIGGGQSDTNDQISIQKKELASEKEKVNIKKIQLKNKIEESFNMPILM